MKALRGAEPNSRAGIGATRHHGDMSARGRSETPILERAAPRAVK